MKKLFVLLAITFCLVTSAVADNKSEPQYQVDITIRYNAVSPDEAARIAKQIMRNHYEACKTEVKQSLIRNNEILSSSSGSGYWSIDHGTGSVFFTPSDN